MDFVLDANILFAALIKDSTTSEILFNEHVQVFAPEFLLEEFYKHKDEILAKTRRSKEDFEEIYETLKNDITLIPFEEFCPFLKIAEKLISDEDDRVYFALAIQLNIPIWSNDKKFREQKIVKIYTTADLMKIIEAMQ
ncbi:TPA: PIN domain-containing protein [Candidatus Woesearchaeota archaeon]|nr:PIN domain-containing protein [Candidatus Woesearchaeota archaeon]HIH47248.1 PIN domain-containing protein [Candidatus Woesearchaeota archaeon]